MLSKRQAEVQRQPILGRIGTDLKMGILGMPNVGKSTLFNVLKKSEAQNIFGTSDPNESKVAVKDKNFDWLVEQYKPPSRVPAYLTVVDIAGLVKGASEGQGLGNAFFSRVGDCDAFFHLCRSFEDTEVTHVEGDVDPIRDLEIINSELRLKDQADLVGALDKIEKLAVNDTTKKLEYDTLLKVKELLETKFVRQHDWNEKEVEVLNKHLFLTAKPIVYLVNLSEQDFIKKENKWLPKINAWIDENDPGSTLIPFSGAFELKSAGMDSEKRAQYFKETGASSALDQIIQTGYKALGLEHFFEASRDEVRAVIIQRGKPTGVRGIPSHYDEEFLFP